MKRREHHRKIIKRTVAVLLAFILAVTPESSAWAAPDQQSDTTQTETTQTETETTQTETAQTETETAQAETTQSETVSVDETAEYVSDEIIVVYEDADVSDRKSEQIQEDAKEALADCDIEVTETITEATDEQGTVVAAEIPSDMSVEDAVEEAQADENVSYAQPNYIYGLLEEDTANTEDMSEDSAEESDETSGSDEAQSTDETQSADEAQDIDETQETDAAVETQMTVNDPFKESDEDSDYYLDATHVTDAWEEFQSNGKVAVAVLDTGCRMDHEDLTANLNSKYAYDAVNGEPLTTASSEYGDVSGHGTHVCGLVAAEANNSTGIAGTSYNAQVIPVRVFDDHENATTCTLLAGLSYCEELAEEEDINLRVINMSLGGYMETPDETLRSLIADLEDAGVLCVCAGGNVATTDTLYPSDYEECLSVTSLTKNLTDSTFSDYNQYKDISAPGEKIYSTYNESGTSYAYLTGTSMASPIVAGICAVIFAEYPDLTPGNVIEGIRETATEIEDQDEERSESSGSAGLINADAALDYFGGRAYDLKERDAQITFDDEETNYLYTGEAIRPSIQVSCGGEVLTQGTDYNVRYTNNTAVGTATVRVIGIGSYYGTVTKTFTITHADISSAKATLSKSSFTYTGSAVTPGITLTYGGKTLKNGTDYTVSYSGNYSVGTACLTVKGKGNFQSSFTKSFAITQASISSAKATLSGSSFTYTGSAITPGITLTYGGKTLKNGTDYTVSYSGNRSIGTAYLTVTGKGNFQSSLRKSFQIVPQGTKITSLSKRKKGFKIKWKKKTSNTTGYQIQYSLKSNFSSAKTKTVKSYKTKTKTISGLKRKKYYYVRIRTYKTVGGVRYYSAWSASKRVKTK